MSPAFLDAFFQGYADCRGADDFFSWLSPVVVTQTRGHFFARPEVLAGIRVGWGGCDVVVDLRELTWTTAILAIDCPVWTFPSWGNYPGIDETEEWTGALVDELAAAGELR